MNRSATETLSQALNTLDLGVTLAHPETLREQVCAVVNELKLGGLAPEQVVVAVKDIVIGANPKVANTQLLREMVRWCIQQYFAEPH